MRHQGRKSSISPAFVMLLASLAVSARVNSQNLTPNNALKMTLVPSREMAVAGSDFGITVRLENVSDRTIYFTPRSFSMVVPPELDPGSASEWYAFFPLVQDPNMDTSSKDYWPKYYATVIPLKPGSNIPAFLHGGAQNPDIGFFREFIRRINFSPGKYTFTVAGRYWDTADGPTKNTEPQIETAEMQETINAPQTTILLGAALGGLFAFLLVWRHDPSLYDGWGLKTHLGWISAILLSIIVTILLARLSDTQFFIRVTVNDLWGAMAVGFLAAAAGPNILQKFINALGGRVEKPQGQQQEKLEPVEQDGATRTAVVSNTSSDASKVNKAA